MADTSIPALKRAFLQSQVRILSAPLEPTEDWREQAGDVPEEGDLDDRSVDAVLNKVNTLLRQHNNAAFPAPALAHVAAQIDALYWATSEPLTGVAILQDGEIDRKADLTADEIIGSLPDEWPEEEEDEDEEEEEEEEEGAREEHDKQLQPTQTSSTTSRKRKSTASRKSTVSRKSTASRASGLEAFAEGARYKQLHAKLLSLQEERARARRRLAQATKLRDMLKPLQDPAANVQPNLVTRDGELGKELERMVMLGARVGGKLGEKRG